jgi:hypothetical protein
MHVIWIKTFALAAVLTGAGLLFGQNPQQPGQNPQGTKTDPAKGPDEKPAPKADKEAPPKTKLEEMIQQALRNNADIRVAEAKVAEAEAELNRTRLVIMQKVVLYNTNVADAKAKVAVAERHLKRLQELNQRGAAAVSVQEIDTAEAELQSAKANLAKVEAELPLLLGTPAHGRAADPAIEKGFEFFRRASLDLYGDPNAWREGRPELDRVAAEQWFKYLQKDPKDTIDTNTAFALAALAAAGVKPPVQGPMAERIKNALDKPIKVDISSIDPRSALMGLLDRVDGVSYIIPLKVPELGPNTIDLKFDHEVPLGAALQAWQDVCSPSVRMVVREYGILVTDDKHVPPGASLLYDVWKGGKDARAARAAKAAERVEGKVKAVDDKAKLFMIDIGSDAGLKKGDLLELYRPDPKAPKYLGRLKVVEVKATEAVAEPFGGAKDGEVKVGDNVTSQLHDK